MPAVPVNPCTYAEEQDWGKCVWEQVKPFVQLGKSIFFRKRCERVLSKNVFKTSRCVEEFGILVDPCLVKGSAGEKSGPGNSSLGNSWIRPLKICGRLLGLVSK